MDLRLPVLVVAVVLASSAHAQRTPVYQSGTISSRDVARFTTNGTVEKAPGLSGDVNGWGVNPFSITDNLGLGLCSNSGDTGGSHYEFCLGHDGSGNALLSSTAHGGALEKSIYLNKNGTLYEIPFVGAGSGNVVGPASSTAGMPALFNNTGGTLLSQPTTSVTWPLTVNLAPPTGSAQGLKTTQNITGTGVTDTWFNQNLISSDGFTAAQHNLFGGGVHHICCANTAQGYRFALAGRIDVTSAWSALDPEAVFVGVLGNARGTVNAPSVGAMLQGGNHNVDLSNNATGWNSVIGTETDVIIRSGVAAPQTKTGHTIVLGALDAVSASGFDAAHHYINAGSSGGWVNLFMVDTTLGGNPIVKTTGQIMNFRGAMTVAEVFNLAALTVTGSIIAGPGGNMSIAGDGAIYTSNKLFGSGDIGATYPTSTVGTGWARTGNFSAANAEIIDWNTRDANVAGQSFEWRQKSGASASNVLMQLVGRANALATTTLKLRVNNTTNGEAVVDVTLGAADSGGAGFRALRVVN